MVIFFVSNQPELCQIMAERLRNHSCFVFYRTDLLSEAIENMKEPPQLIVMDYKMFNHDIFNIYQNYKDNHMYIPTIFYNDPCIFGDELPLHWKTIIEVTKRQWEHFDYNEYMPIFKEIEIVVKDPKYAPFIPLMRQELPFPQELAITKLSVINDHNYIFHQIVEFKKKSKMKQRLYEMMEVFFNSYDKEMTPAAIQQKYKENGNPLKIESIKVRISELKSFFENADDCPFVILKKKNKFRLAMF